tara:strand:- start:545 stop:1924 length:1380 start_codon:yes stop_codon:yes gene_type:complete
MSDSTKSIFLLLPTGITVRNFLTTGVIDELILRNSIKIIIFTFSPIDFIQYRPENDKIIIKKLSKRRIFTLSNILHVILKRRFFKINETASTKILSKGPLFPKEHNYFIEYLLSQPFPKSRVIYGWLRRILGFLNGFPSHVKDNFDYYKPSLVISTHPIANNETEFLQCAKKLRVNTIGMIKSWDNLTTKGYLPVVTNHFIVWNEVMQKEMMRMHNIPKSMVTITGVPQFDSYSDCNNMVEKEDFFSNLGLNLDKKTILYFTSPASIAPEDPEILLKLHESFLIEKKDNVQIIVRLHPLDSIQRYEKINKNMEQNLSFQVPGGSLKGDANFRMQDPMFINELRDTLFYSDVTINTCSSTSLDAVAMDRPVINIAFDLQEKPYLRSCKRYYDFDHFQPILKTGATKLALSFKELTKLIIRYFENPELENKEREQLRSTMCYQIDGQSSKRIADSIMEQLD